MILCHVLYKSTHLLNFFFFLIKIILVDINNQIRNFKIQLKKLNTIKTKKLKIKNKIKY